MLLPVRTKNITGLKSGKLTAREFIKVVKGRGAHWWCECECGKTKLVSSSHIQQNLVKSCGCEGSGVLQRKPWGEAAFGALYRRYKADAKRKGREFKLDKNVSFRKLVTGCCTYCGCEPRTSTGTYHNEYYGDFIYNGIDRIDSSKGYISENCVTACRTCNVAKLDRTLDEFKQWVVQVYNNLNLS